MRDAKCEKETGGPLMVYVGRVAKEKNIEAFLELGVKGRKRVVGGGPMLAEYVERYPEVEFTGVLTGEALAEKFAEGDVFVFPSLTDTFGLVLLEALACGVPVAAYPEPGPREVVDCKEVGAVDEDLGRAVERALEFGDRGACRRRAMEYSWRRAAEEFLGNLVAARGRAGRILEAQKVEA